MKKLMLGLTIAGALLLGACGLDNTPIQTELSTHYTNVVETREGDTFTIKAEAIDDNGIGDYLNLSFETVNVEDFGYELSTLQDDIPEDVETLVWVITQKHQIEEVDKYGKTTMVDANPSKLVLEIDWSEFKKVTDYEKADIESMVKVVEDDIKYGFYDYY